MKLKNLFTNKVAIKKWFTLISIFCLVLTLCIFFLHYNRLTKVKIQPSYDQEYLNSITLVKIIDMWKGGPTSNQLPDVVVNGTLWDLFYVEKKDGDIIWSYKLEKNKHMESGYVLVRRNKILEVVTLTTS